jgi:hypothetical protein
MRGFFAALMNDSGESGLEVRRRAKGNAGVLRCAQNDRRGKWIGGPKEGQRKCGGFFAALRMTAGKVDWRSEGEQRKCGGSSLRSE